MLKQNSHILLKSYYVDTLQVFLSYNYQKRKETDHGKEDSILIKKLKKFQYDGYPNKNDHKVDSVRVKSKTEEDHTNWSCFIASYAEYYVIKYLHVKMTSGEILRSAYKMVSQL